MLAILAALVVDWAVVEGAGAGAGAGGDGEVASGAF